MGDCVVAGSALVGRRRKRLLSLDERGSVGIVVTGCRLGTDCSEVDECRAEVWIGG